MFTNLRKLSDNILAKALLIALAISLVIWGAKIGSDVDSYVAIIGKKNYIHKSDFIRAKRIFLHNMRQTHNKNDLEDSNVNKIVLNSLIRHELLKAATTDLKIVVKQDVAFEEIKNMQAFKNSEGKFDKDIFKNSLAANGITESEFVDNVKSDIAMDILNSMFTSFTPSENFVKEFYNHSNQKRVVDLITIRPSTNFIVGDIQDKDIENYYSNNKKRFAVGESRDVEYIKIEAPVFKIKISDEELKKEVDSSNESKKDKAFIDGVRANLIRTKTYKATSEYIRNIEDEIASGATLKDIASKHPGSVKYVFISKLTQTSENQSAPKFEQFMPQAFSLPQASPSETFAIKKNLASGDSHNTPYDYYILNVPKIYEPHHKPLDANVRKQVIESLNEERKEKILKEEAFKIYNLVVSGKASLEQIIKENPNVSLKETILGRAQQKGDNTDKNLLMDIFNSKNKISYTNIFKSKELYAFQFAIVKNVQLPQAPTSLEKANAEAQLSLYLKDTIKQEFIAYLHSKYKVRVFPNILKEL
jgi:hypothetical protein